MGAVFIVMGVVFLGLACVPSLTLWRATSGWRYADPEANRPSETALALKKLRNVVVGLVLGGFGIAVQDWDGVFSSSATNLRATVEAAVEWLEEDTVDVPEGRPDGTLERRVAAAVRASAPGTFEAEVGHIDEERYEVTARRTEDVYCLSITMRKANQQKDWTDDETVHLRVTATDSPC
ncbi:MULTISPECIES: hypothetical protein [unclassified Streptomyces]|uniref:hypothetical protein n=1 Tax=unclassified Streptomyces TaxID=2593676 RepID=UPI000CD5072D|nr:MULTISPECIES: hypothetical protein [unclassified Streptomyces]